VCRNTFPSSGPNIAANVSVSIVLTIAVFNLPGCGGASSFHQGPAATSASSGLKGKVLGGQQPITDSTIQLYAAGSIAYGSGAQALLTTAVITDQNGNFTIPSGAYTCPANNPETYVVATGGDPGVGSNNPAIALMAALGPCNGLSPTTNVFIDEVTTVASVWPLAPFMNYGAQVGTISTNQPGLSTAFANVNELVNIATGTSPGTSVPQGVTIPVAEINTLSNILASCVNSTGTTACNALFTAAAPPGGTAATNTLDATLDIALNPTNNVGALFALATASAPFAPTLPSAPANWTFGNAITTNPVPVISSLAPVSLPVGSAPQTLTINGTGFLASSTVTFNGIAHAATFVSVNQLTISLTSADLGTAGSYPVVVTNPVPGGGASGAASFVVGPNSVSVSVTPKRAGLTVTQSLSLTATSSDGSGVNWTATGSSCSGTTCGTFSSPSGSPVTYTAPGTAGQYTITATDASNSVISSSVTVGVTDLAGVATYHNDVSRDGLNNQEYALAPSNVTTSTFGKLFSCTVDGAIYAQPLWVPNLTFSGVQHNVIFVATQHDSLYAFDADTSPCTTLWHANLIDTAHGGTTGESSVPNTLVGSGYGDIMPEIGVTGTPVINVGTKLLYVVSKSVNTTGPIFYQRLHAIDLLTGSEMLSGPVTISGTFPASNSTVTFSPQQQNQRPGLALVNGVVYIAWASHEDTDPWYGWVMAYDATSLSHLYTFNTTPNASRGGVWMGGGAPSADASGNLYVITGNGNFDVTNSSAPNNDYGDSFLKLTSNLAVSQYFTPADQSSDNTGDQDFGSGGTSVVVDLPPNGTLPNQLVIGGGKDGYLCLLNRNALGGYSSNNTGAVQMLNFGNGIFGTPAYWNSSFYLAGIGGQLQQFTLNLSTYQINSSPASTSATTYSFPGATPSVTTTPDNSNAIVWALNNTQYCTTQSPGCGATVLHAYNATNLGTELWNSSQGTGNAAGYAVKFTVPTVANGKVYVGTRGNNTGGSDTSTSVPGELDVYGLLPN